MLYARSGGMFMLALAIATTLACGSDKTRTTEKAASADSVPVASVPGVAGSAAIDTAAARAPVRQDGGAISVVFSSNGVGALGEFIATLLISDAHGRRTGFNPATGQVVQEIPRAWYSDETIEDPEEEGSGAATRTIEMTTPEPGTYTLTVRAMAEGTYDLSIRGYDARLEPSGGEFSGVAIGSGEVHSYILTFDPASGITVAPR